MEFLIGNTSETNAIAAYSRKISENEFHLRAIQVMEHDLNGFYARYRELYKSVFLIPNAVMSLALPDGETLRVLMDEGQIMEVPRANSFCGCTLENTEIFIVNNAVEDERFRDNPLVREKMHVRFYTGLPLIGLTGRPFGTICMMDTIPRYLEDTRIAMMKDMAKQVVAQVEAEVRIECLSESITGETTTDFHLGTDSRLDLTSENELVDENSVGAASIVTPLSFEIDKIFDLFSSPANSKGVELISSVSEDLVIHFDRDLLSMVLRKAIFNGIKYCIFGGSVKVEAWRSSRHVIVSISDSGAGMEPERVERVLEGSGDGKPIDELSFCKTLLEEKQAQLDILSEKGMGTTITLTFPC